MGDLDNIKALLDIVNSIIIPINQTLSKQTEALIESNNQLNMMVDLFQAEPTRHSIIEKLRAALCDLEDQISKTISDHNAICKERHNEQCILGDKRGQEILREATISMKELVEAHQKQVDGQLVPVKELKDKFDKLLWTIILACGLGVSMFSYLAWTLAHLPIPTK